jgi:hypothetical protein
VDLGAEVKKTACTRISVYHKQNAGTIYNVKAANKSLKRERSLKSRENTNKRLQELRN